MNKKLNLFSMAKEEPKSNPRIGISASFYHIALSAKKEYDDWMKILEKLEQGEKVRYFAYRHPLGEMNGEEKEEIEESIFTLEISTVKRKMDDEVIKIVIFITTFLEACIWDMGAYHLGDKYMKEHLEKLGILSKWEVIPKLVTGSSIKLNDQDLGTFRSLIKFRNFLVHSKSEDLYKLLDRLKEKNERVKSLYEKIDVSSILPFVERLMKELDFIDTNAGHQKDLKDLNLYIEEEENQRKEILKGYS